MGNNHSEHSGGPFRSRMRTLSALRKRASQPSTLDTTDGLSNLNQIDLAADLFKVAEKWVQLTSNLANSENVENAPNVDSTTFSEGRGISRDAFENYFHDAAPFLGLLLFQHFQHSSKPSELHNNPNMLTQKAFVRNVMEILSLTSPHEQIHYYFRVFSRGIGTLHEEDMLLLLTVSVKVACAATGLSRLISDADQQVFHALVRSLDVDPESGVDAMQFGEWVEQNGVHLLNCLHHFVVQSLISCSGVSSQERKPDTHLEDDFLPLLDQDNEIQLQLSSIALLWVLSCSLPRLYIKRSHVASTCRGFSSHHSTGTLSSLSRRESNQSTMHTSPSVPTINPHQFIQQLVEAANLTTWTLLYNSDKHGLSFNRFLHHTLHYNGPTVSIYRLESGSSYCIAVDTEWRESQHRWGGSDCVIYQLQPQFKRLERGANLVYLNEHARGAYRGIEIGGDPKRPILKVESNMHTAVNEGLQDKLVCLEVWGCAGSAPKLAQLEQIRWENRQAEKMQKITRPQRWQDSTDRYLLDLVKNNTRYHDS
ncbi:LOW QUALITY PROTEIN: uncharacterized protein LOC129581103 [Paramacrobiotus metropolitanus]|uniref:LOW QUALITY PROTEIN: uncharacterized protein LOC129581103 n=1 Tax=Paramacrobiotus metropolitanus TaxID=2943436 RepID=UPI002445921D|nr:LOW QUALITY PROTEIN: uncharacterized protein LOC129581103 [Paramacrobiotus metropolitanus]